MARKLAGPEHSTTAEADIAFHEQQYQQLWAQLQTAFEASTLPEAPSKETRCALNNLLVRIRMAGLSQCPA